MSYNNSFFDTVGGQRFASYTVPQLIDKVGELSERIESLEKILGDMVKNTCELTGAINGMIEKEKTKTDVWNEENHSFGFCERT